MKKRYKMSKGKSNRSFSRNTGYHRRNKGPRAMRGGTRL